MALYSWFDLPPDDPRSHDLSAIAWDPTEGVLWALSDRIPRLVKLVPEADFRSWRLDDGIALESRGHWDGEGLGLGAEQFFVSNETGPRIDRFDRTGRLLTQVALPAHFANARHNQALEALGVTPDGRVLFTTSEAALQSDGPAACVREGTLLRILRVDLASGAAREAAYLSDTVFGHGDGGDLGVSEAAALSSSALLVMERAYVPGRGNRVRIYRVDLASAPDVLAQPVLTAATPRVRKSLLIDLDDLPDRGVPPARQRQHNQLLENYEGLALGPSLPDGRRLLVLVSDDNGLAAQTARVLVLAVRGL